MTKMKKLMVNNHFSRRKAHAIYVLTEKLYKRSIKIRRSPNLLRQRMYEDFENKVRFIIL